MKEDMIRFRLEFAKVTRMYYGRMQAMLAEVGLNRGQPPIMGLLSQNGGMSQKEMAHALNLSPATMTVALKRMEKAGLVSREMDENDQRILRVNLSEQGREMCVKGDEISDRVTAELLDGFSKEEQEQLHEYMCRIVQNMEKVVKKDGKSADGYFTEGFDD